MLLFMYIFRSSPWNFLFFSMEVPGRSRGGTAWLIPVRMVARGGGYVGELLEDVDAYLLVPEIEAGVVGKVVTGVDGGGSA